MEIKTIETELLRKGLIEKVTCILNSYEHKKNMDECNKIMGKI